MRTLTLFIVAALSAAWWVATRPVELTPRAPRAADAPTVAWPIGAAATYTVDYRSAQAVRLGTGEPLEGRLALAGTLQISRPDAGHLRLRLVDLSTHTLTLLGGEVLAEPTILTQTEAVAELNPDATVAAVSLPPDAPAAARHVYALLAGDLQWASGASAREATGRGVARAVYRRTAEQEERVRTGYEPLVAVPPIPGQTVELDAVHTAHIDDRGLVSLEGSERLEVTAPDATRRLDLSASLHLRRRTHDTATATPALAGWHRTVPGDARLHPDAERRGLEQLADGLTFGRVADDLFAFGAGGRMPDHNRWLARAHALLKLHPGRALELLPVFLDPTLSAGARSILADLWASVGHGPAQSALRQALEDPAIRDERAFPLWLQRLSFVDAPEAKTVGLLERASAEPGPTGHAATYALGAAADNLRRSGRPEAADALAERLRTDLRAADDDHRRAALLHALGNAHDVEALPIVRSFADADASAVRAAAATAARDLGPGGQRLLADLAADDDAQVQRAAVGGMEPSDANRDRVQNLASDGVLSPVAWPAALKLVRDVRDPAQRALAQALLDHAPPDPRLRARLRRILRSAEQEG